MHMMVYAQASRASLYREKSDAVRLLASRTQFPDTRAQLLALAESFEKLAEHVNTWVEVATAAD
jgi:hypothetical protein